MSRLNGRRIAPWLGFLAVVDGPSPVWGGSPAVMSFDSGTMLFCSGGSNISQEKPLRERRFRAFVRRAGSSARPPSRSGSGPGLFTLEDPGRPLEEGANVPKFVEGPLEVRSIHGPLAASILRRSSLGALSPVKSLRPAFSALVAILVAASFSR